LAARKQPPPPPEEGPRLSRERILDAALDVVGREGVEALSMRRLAEELNVWPMSVYRYFRDKDELLEAIAGSAANQIAVPSTEGSWRAQLRELLHAARDAFAVDAPGLAGHLPRAFLAPEMLHLSESALAILRAAGFPDDEAANAWRALWSYAFGFTVFRLGGTPGEALRAGRTAVASVPEDEYPSLAAAGDEFAAAFAAEDRFDYGLERLLDGIEARAEEAARAAT
jgi:TetR/AcrR family tetracycline transcriptional repressor